ncbi:MAG: prenyltransferase/squalene oxidase repeat-containing protein [Pirellulaceae bacterium]
MAIWCGFAVLTFVLVVLMVTRWGQVKPLWKCVVLSVFAHVLFGCYAYGTKLIFTAPTPPPSDTFALKIIESRDLDNEALDNQTTQNKPWDEFDLPAESQPQVQPLNRPSESLEQTISRTRPEQNSQLVQPERVTEVTGEIETPVRPAHVSPPPEAATDAHRIDGQVARAPDIEINRQRREEPSGIAAPSAGQLSRMEPIIDPDLQAELRTVPEPLADEGLEVEQLLQQLADAADSATQHDTTPSEALTQDMESQQSELRWGDPADHEVDPFQFASAPRRLADGSPLPALYAGRSLEERQRKAERHGGSLETERAVNDALAYLARSQEPDGSWDPVKHNGGRETLVLGHDRKGAGANAQTAITGLSLLAFLASGHSHLEGEHQETVRKGIEYLLNQQRANGSLAGNSRLFAQMYCHAMATFAISETLAMTGDQRLKPAVEMAVNYSLEAQNRRSGGWRYRPGDGDVGDMSQFGWQVLALKSAELGGVRVPSEAQNLMKRFLESCSAGRSGGLAGYRPHETPSVTMTAEALLCRYFLYGDVPAETANEATQYLLREVPGSGEENFYYWYYGTLAMFHTGGQAWSNWNQHLTQELVGSQIRLGDHAGSWEPTGVWCGYGGRIYSTAMATLCLEVYYRYQIK